MKYTKNKTIQTFHSFVDLEPEDYILVKLPDRKIVALKYSTLTGSLNLSLIGEGGLIDKEPFWVITREQMEDLDCGKTKGQYVSITFPSALYAQVKERLKGLPIII